MRKITMQEFAEAFLVEAAIMFVGFIIGYAVGAR